MENSLTIVPVKSLAPSEHEIMVYHSMAEQAVNSKMYKGIGDKSGVMMIMLSARELGISPMMALNGGLNIINGKVEISARMMSALIRKAGHRVKVKECSATECVLVGERCDTGEIQAASFSVEEAKQAGIFKAGGGWTKWPKDMCFARALSRLARQLFSDVIGIGYVEGEIQHHAEIQPVISEDVLTEEIHEIQEIEVDNVAEHVEKFINLFDREDKQLALEYLKVVQKHFDWTAIQTVKELMKDENKLFEKFNSWKSKFKTKE